MAGIERASDFLGGQTALAEALGISPRFLRHKISAERPIRNDDLRLAAASLRARALNAIALADKLTGLIDEDITS